MPPPLEAPFLLLEVASGVPPTFWREDVTRAFAISTWCTSPAILTALKPRDLVDWSIVILAPLSCSISLARPPPLPNSQPTHFCSTWRSSSASAGAPLFPMERTLSSETSMSCLAVARCSVLPCSCATVKPMDRVPWFMEILQPLCVSISRTTLPPLPSSQPTNLCSMCSSSYMSGPGPGGASMRKGPMAPWLSVSFLPTTARANEVFMCSAACCTDAAWPLTFILLYPSSLVLWSTAMLTL
mmetsp:Transcript_53335/g.159136  ORF Transcript_53335/g.159136 Transcript_53335/m.159136 type:complete len:242 (-) Transcript_53335:254-979(-)